MIMTFQENCYLILKYLRRLTHEACKYCMKNIKMMLSRENWMTIFLWLFGKLALVLSPIWMSMRLVVPDILFLHILYLGYLKSRYWNSRRQIGLEGSNSSKWSCEYVSIFQWHFSNGYACKKSQFFAIFILML